jgi:hypothetical protein
MEDVGDFSLTLRMNMFEGGFRVKVLTHRHIEYASVWVSLSRNGFAIKRCDR